MLSKEQKQINKKASQSKYEHKVGIRQPNQPASDKTPQFVNTGPVDFSAQASNAPVTKSRTPPTLLLVAGPSAPPSLLTLAYRPVTRSLLVDSQLAV